MELMLEGVTERHSKQEKLLRARSKTAANCWRWSILLDIDRLETGSLTLDIEEFSLSGWSTP
jgi:hypothetical protein